MFSHVAPAGTPIETTDLVGGVRATVRPSRSSGDLADELCNLAGVQHAWPVSSGRAAMTTILEVMKSTRPGLTCDEVIIPAYTCYSVPAAIERAGLHPQLCDVDPSTLAIDPAALERCDFSRVLAVITTSLYGVPDDLPAIEAICRKRGVYMLDDAAQALGARVGDRAVGAFGDAGLYSFDKGKIICTMQGGAIVARDSELVPLLSTAVAALPATPALTAAFLYAQLLAYAALMRPRLYGFVQRLPGTGLGRTVYETQFPIARLAALQGGVATALLRRLPELNRDRRVRARLLAEAVTGFPGVAPALIPPESLPVFARYPIRATPAGLRQRVIESLVAAGIGATRSYPRALIDVPEVAARLRRPDTPMPGARWVAESIVTLPTHGYCPPDMPRHIHSIFSGCASTGRPAPKS